MLTLEAKGKPDVQTGMLIVPHGVPNHNINALIPSGVAYVEPLSGNHWMTGFPVTVTAVDKPIAAD